MRRLIVVAASIVALLLLQPRFARADLIDWVTVGNPGNAGDVRFNGTFGAVDYNYRIGKHEVTNSQYTVFLNAVARSDPNGLYNGLMGSDARGGIVQSGVDPNFTYSVKPNMGDKPVNFVSFYDALRFANWLHNDQPTGAQGNTTTDDGAYTITEAGIAAGDIIRNVGARTFLTSENEWYKAAYYDPINSGADANGSVDYWLFPTQSDIAPTAAAADSMGNISNPGPNVANGERNADWNSQDGNVTTVGSAGSGSASFFGTFDQSGNVWELNETILDFGGPLYRGLRGSGWIFETFFSNSDFSLAHNPFQETPEVGFRVASLPPPTKEEIVYVANYYDDSIVKFDQNGVATLFVDTVATNPLGLAFDSSRNLFVAFDNEIRRFTPAGDGSVFANNLLAGAIGLAFDSEGDLFAANNADNNIIRFTPDGIGSIFATATGSPGLKGLAFDSSGNLYAAQTSDNTIRKYTPDGAESVFASTGLADTYGLAFDSLGNLYAANASGGTIHKFSASGIDLGIFASGLNNPLGLAIDALDNVYVANFNNNTILKFAPDGSGSLFADTGMNGPTFIAIQTVSPGEGGLIPPSSYTVFRGIELNGTLADFANSDDVAAKYQPGFVLNSSEAPVWLEFFGSTLSATSFLVESNAGTPGLTYTIEAWNWNTSAYEVLGTHAEAFNTDSITIFDIIPVNHIDSGGNVRVRVGWRKTGFTINFPWEVRVDQVGWNQ